MAKYEESFKLLVVRQHLSESVGTRTLATRHGLDQATVRRWVQSYAEHGIQGLRKKFSHYSAKFKLFVLEMMWRDELSRRQVAIVFDVRGGHSAVAIWERQYHAGGPQALEPKPRGRSKTMPTSKPTPVVQPQTDDARALKALREENEYLRAEVAYLKKLDALVRANRQAAQNKRKPSSN